MDTSNPAPEHAIATDRATLQPLIVKLLQRKGMFVAEAEIVADRMLDADEQGIPAAGVATLSEFLEAMDLGDIDPRARLIVIRESATSALLDGSTGMGHVAVTRAMVQAVEKAEAGGIGSVVVRNSRHCGDLGVIARQAAGRGLIGVAFASGTNGSPDNTVAWAIPGTGGLAAAVHRGPVRGTPLEPLVNVLTAGLASAEPPPRKSKAARFANAVEYHLLTLNPQAFECGESLNRWQATQMAASETAVQILLPQEVAAQLAALAARIKFALPWAAPVDPAG